jgi:hypothetical protein
VRDIAAIAGTPFFETVRSTAIVSLYSNALAYQHWPVAREELDPYFDRAEKKMGDVQRNGGGRAAYQCISA